MATTTLTITVTTSAVLSKVRRNLAVIGKRVKDKDGSPLYSDITTSTNEDPLFSDLTKFGAETVVSGISDVASSYTATDTTGSVSFVITSTRWNYTTSTPDLTNALSGLISDYLYNFCLSRYLSTINAQLAQSYTDHCTLIMQNIKTLAFLKREKEKCNKSYADVK